MNNSLIDGDDIPPFKGNKPDWADASKSDVDLNVTHDGHPMAIWLSEKLFNLGDIDGSIIREDIYNPDTDQTTEGEIGLQVWAGEPCIIKTPEDARAFAFGLLAAADRFEEILYNLHPTYEPHAVYDPLDHSHLGDVVNLPIPAEGDLSVVREVNPSTVWGVNVHLSGSEHIDTSTARLVAEQIVRAAHLADRLNKAD